MSLKESLTTAMKDAMRSKDKIRLSTIRLALAAIKQVEVDERIELDDSAVLSILIKLVKQRRDSITQYTDANRKDLADIEQQELEILTEFMPKQLDESEILAEVEAAIATSNAQSAKDIGKVMAILKPKLAGKADLSLVSKIIKGKL